MTEGRTVRLHTSSMVDSMSDWPLGKVVEVLRRREKEAGGAPQSIRLCCRSTVRSLRNVMKLLSAEYGVSRSRMCSWLSYHGRAIASDDQTIASMVKVMSVIRSTSIPKDDTDTLDMMNSRTPYSPRVIAEGELSHLILYDSSVASSFEEVAEACGVYIYQATQIHIVKSILTGEAEKLGDLGVRLIEEVSRWDKWMRFRSVTLEGLVNGCSGES